MIFSKKPVVVTIIVLLSAASLMQVLAGYAGDKNWLLLAAKMWLGGGTLYGDIVEVNPPLIVWLYALPVRMAQALPLLQDYQVLGLLGLFACAASVSVSTRLIRLHPAFAEDKQKQLAFALLLALLLVFFTGPTYFFDREHILLVLAFPYIIRFMPGLACKKMPIGLLLSVGVMAAIAFSIKPYAAIPFAALQLLYIQREHSLSILGSLENRIIYGFIIAYMTLIWYFAPDYIHVIFPMALATYSAFSRRLFGMFYGFVALIIAGVAFADFRPRFTTPYRKDVYYLAGVSASLLAYALVNNGWGYTYHPLIVMLLFLTGLLYLEYAWLKQKEADKGLPVKPFVFGMRACALSLAVNAAYMLYIMMAFYVTPACDWSSDCVKNRPYVAYLAAHNIRSFGALSEDFHKWPSLARLSGASFETRYNALWMVPKLVKEDRELRARHQWIVDDVGAGLADDLVRRKPQIVFVDTSPDFFGYGFAVDLPALFSEEPAFRQAWAQYRYVDVIDSCKPRAAATGCRYAIYQQTP